MKLIFLIFLMAALPCWLVAGASERTFFSYPYSQDDLPNGLRLITVPTENPNLVALYIVVRTGSRNEVEPGKSGFAHLFEHMMFRGSEHFTATARDALLKRAGAESNAYTDDDRTVYHEVFAKEDLDKIMELEADRFQRLKYDSDVYKTETRAVLGEYNKNSADPSQKLEEVLRGTAFRHHTYRHTTMGFIEDIEKMPEEFDYSWQFYHRYYRPEYTTIILVGDLTQQRALDLTRRFFGDWKRGDYAPAIPAEPPQVGPLTNHIDWPSPTLPQICVAFHGPPYSDETPDKAALDLLALIAFGENSVLYQRLVLQEQKVDELDVSFSDLVDPELCGVSARVKNPQDVDYVREQILATFKRITREPVPLAQLEATRSHLRYTTALALDSSESIAGFLAPYIALRRSPDTIDRLFSLYARITPEQVRETAARYFVENHRIIVTLATKN
jgi:zinc protease